MPKLPENKLVNRGLAGLKSKDGKLTNRGPAGLVAKQPVGPNESVQGAANRLPHRPPKGPVNNIIEDLKDKARDVAGLIFDPMNARLHPERNMESIEDSLNLYGQRTPLVVNKRTMHVLKGNGTLQAAKNLGWTKVAAVFVDDAPHVAAGYGLADNRTAEHARWDFEVVARIDRMMQDEGLQQVGWTLPELEALRSNIDDAPAVPQVPGNGQPQTADELWQGMPEFDQQDQTSASRIVVHFRSDEDKADFLKIVGQTAGDVRQNSIWHPKAEIGRFADKRYKVR